jgi:hypothetical protein
VSEDAAASWRALKAPWGEGEIIALAASPAYARERTIFVAIASATEAVLWRSTDGGERWQRWLVAPGRHDTLPVAFSPDFRFDDLVFVGLGGRVLKPLPHAHEVQGRERRPIWRGLDLGGDVSAITALAVSPAFAADHTIFAATNAGLFVSRDAGDSFTPWSEGLLPARMVAVAVSPAYAQDRLVYAVGLGGTLWRRREEA